jgi:uncharacterized membrane protein
MHFHKAEGSIVMYSKAKIAGHPIHPMLVGFPIALYTATVACLLAFAGNGDAFWFRAALTANVAGLVMAGLAIIPGAIDLFSLPNRSSARTAGYAHAGFNVAANVLFLINAIIMWRAWDNRALADAHPAINVVVPAAIGIVGLLTLVVAGALGWSLVQTHHVGVDMGPQLERAGAPGAEIMPPPPLPRREPEREIPIRH